MKLLMVPLLASLLMPVAASAAVHIVSFSATGPWMNFGNPYGLQDEAVSGSFKVDDTIGATTNGGFTFVPEAAFFDLQYVTGTKSWQTSDLGDFVSATFLNGSLLQFSFGLNGAGAFLNSGGFVSSNNTLSTQDGFKFRSCNSCVTFTSQVLTGVPEPESWAMLCLGFALAGLALRLPRGTKISKFAD